MRSGDPLARSRKRHLSSGAWFAGLEPFSNSPFWLVWELRSCELVWELLSCKIDDALIKQVDSTKYLGITFDSNLTWKSHLMSFV